MATAIICYTHFSFAKALKPENPILLAVNRVYFLSYKSYVTFLSKPSNQQACLSDNYLVTLTAPASLACTWQLVNACNQYAPITCFQRYTWFTKLYAYACLVIANFKFIFLVSKSSARNLFTPTSAKNLFLHIRRYRKKFLIDTSKKKIFHCSAQQEIT